MFEDADLEAVVNDKPAADFAANVGNVDNANRTLTLSLSLFQDAIHWRVRNFASRSCLTFGDGVVCRGSLVASVALGQEWADERAVFGCCDENDRLSHRDDKSQKESDSERKKINKCPITGTKFGTAHRKLFTSLAGMARCWVLGEMMRCEKEKRSSQLAHLVRFLLLL